MNKPSHIFCYVRPWNVEQFKFIAQRLAPNSKIICCSEHPKIDEANISSNYYINLKKAKKQEHLNLPGIDEYQITELIQRCRLLRKLQRNEALQHVWAMGMAIAQALDKSEPRLVLSLTIDSYVMDLFRLLSEARGIRFVGLIGTFVNGYYRVSARGEQNFNSSTDPSIIEDLLAKLIATNYTPAFNLRSVSKPRRSVQRRWIANLARVPYFFSKRIFSGDYYNYHYWVSQLVSMEHAHLCPPRDPGNYAWTQRIRNSKKQKIFIPLQMFPECTVDYWCQNIKAIDYYKTLTSLINKLSERFQVVVKEHPSVMGSRPRGFYRSLSTDHRVIVVPTYEPSNNVLNEVDGVVVWTGSVGFEAILRGKAVFGLAWPYYASGDRLCLISEDPDLDAMIQHIERCSANPITKHEQHAVMHHLVNQLFKGTFTNDGSWNQSDIQHVGHAEEMAASLLKGYIDPAS